MSCPDSIDMCDPLLICPQGFVGSLVNWISSVIVYLTRSVGKLSANSPHVRVYSIDLPDGGRDPPLLDLLVC